MNNSVFYEDGIYIGLESEIKNEAKKIVDIISAGDFSLIQARYILKEAERLLDILPKDKKISELQKMSE